MAVVGIASVTAAAFLFGIVAALVKYASVPPLALLQFRSIVQLALSCVAVQRCGPADPALGAALHEEQDIVFRSVAKEEEPEEERKEASLAGSERGQEEVEKAVRSCYIGWAGLLNVSRSYVRSCAGQDLLGLMDRKSEGTTSPDWQNEAEKRNAEHHRWLGPRLLCASGVSHIYTHPLPVRYVCECVSDREGGVYILDTCWSREVLLGSPQQQCYIQSSL